MAIETETTLFHGGHHATLSLLRSESSYGRPVLVVDGIAHGPGDDIDGMPLLLANTNIPATADPIDVEALFANPATQPPPEVDAWNRRVIAAWRAMGRITQPPPEAVES